MPMIRSGRCDECRRRKRKCNEARPTCSGCADRRVHCEYSTEVSKFVHLHQIQSEDSSDGDSTRAKPTQQPSKQIVLSIRSSKEPPSGTGRYHTFVPSKTNARSKSRQARKDVGPRSESISPPPCNDITRLQNEFGSILHSSSTPGMHMRLWGYWMELAMLRIGTSPLLDRSIACLIAGHKARYANDTMAMHIGRQRYGEALTLLRDTVAGGTETVTSNVIAATKMLMSFELIVGSDVSGWMSHAYGCVGLYLAAGRQACDDDFARAVFYSTYGQAWQQGIIIGKPSVFDKPEWLDMPPAPRASLNNAFGNYSTRSFTMFTRLPRLTSLARTLKEDPNKREVARKAVKVAKELLELDWEVDGEWEPRAEIVPTARAEDAMLVPFSFKYSEPEYHLVINIALTAARKIMLSGLCQTLYTCGAALEWPSLAELFDKERRCALTICMLVDYAAALAPYGCTPLMFCMQIAFSVYWRQRGFPVDTDMYGMQEWILRRGNEFMGVVNGHPMTTEGLAFFAERLTAGPIVRNDFMKDTLIPHNVAEAHVNAVDGSCSWTASTERRIADEADLLSSSIKDEPEGDLNYDETMRYAMINALHDAKSPP